MNGFLRLIAFACMISGVFYVFEISPKIFIEALSAPFQKQKNIKKRVLYTKGKKKKNSIILLIEDTQNTLKLNGKENVFPQLCILALGCAMTGMILGFILSNYFLLPVLTVGMSIVPFLYIKFIGIRLDKQLNDELETALSIVTTSYIRSENIVSAIEENKDYLNEPIKSIFEQFVLEAELLNPDIKELLANMKTKINNTVFIEWCDAIISCQQDVSLKSTLIPITKKLSNIRIISVKLDALLYAPVKEYVTMVILLIFNVPMMYFLNKEWFHILVDSIPGQLVLAISAAIIFISALAVVKISKPIEYKR